jgi:guanylate kinase
MKKYPELAFSVSAATRPARGKEKDGVDYYFISLEEFKRRIVDNEFIEWEMVYEGKYYGTLKSQDPGTGHRCKRCNTCAAGIPDQYIEHFY